MLQIPEPLLRQMSAEEKMNMIRILRRQRMRTCSCARFLRQLGLEHRWTGKLSTGGLPLLNEQDHTYILLQASSRQQPHLTVLEALALTRRPPPLRPRKPPPSSSSSSSSSSSATQSGRGVVMALCRAWLRYMRF